jgi:hypothetical protein
MPLEKPSPGGPQYVGLVSFPVIPAFPSTFVLLAKYDVFTFRDRLKLYAAFIDNRCVNRWYQLAFTLVFR